MINLQQQQQQQLCSNTQSINTQTKTTTTNQLSPAAAGQPFTKSCPKREKQSEREIIREEASSAAAADADAHLVRWEQMRLQKVLLLLLLCRSLLMRLAAADQLLLLLISSSLLAKQNLVGAATVVVVVVLAALLNCGQRKSSALKQQAISNEQHEQKEFYDANPFLSAFFPPPPTFSSSSFSLSSFFLKQKSASTVWWLDLNTIQFNCETGIKCSPQLAACFFSLQVKAGAITTRKKSACVRLSLTDYKWKKTLKIRTKFYFNICTILLSILFLLFVKCVCVCVCECWIENEEEESKVKVDREEEKGEEKKGQEFFFVLLLCCFCQQVLKSLCEVEKSRVRASVVIVIHKKNLSHSKENVDNVARAHKKLLLSAHTVCREQFACFLLRSRASISTDGQKNDREWCKK